MTFNGVHSFGFRAGAPVSMLTARCRRFVHFFLDAFGAHASERREAGPVSDRGGEHQVMPFISTLLFFFALLASSNAAEAPTGDWLVAKRIAVIRIVDCEGKLWGVVAWEQHPALDRNNADPAKRSRPTLGMPVLLGMQPSGPNEWSGEIYNSRDGRTYDANISLAQPNVLRVEGCVLGFLCGGEDWTRVRPGANGTPTDVPHSGALAGEPPQQICRRLLGAGSAHQGGLK
jgi:uncharacterized protein (DUF2147 family)